MLDFKANDTLEKQPFIVRQISKKVSQNNKEYYHVQLSHGIKNYDAKIWSGDDNISKEINAGCIANIWGTAREFKGNIQIHISKIEKIENPDEATIDIVTPSCELSSIKLSKEILSLMELVKDQHLNKLLHNVFDDEDISDSFYKHAAGAEIHHAYTGGLAQHTIEVTKIVIHYCSLFNNINPDLAITAALLHDIGKTIELSDFPENKYTDMGRLLGHIAIGVMLLNKSIKDIENFPEEYKLSLEHCILSHHGTLEAGSPILPMTLEAIALHNADRSSAELNGFQLAIQRDTNSGLWTDYNSTYKRYLRKPGTI